MVRGTSKLSTLRQPSKTAYVEFGQKAVAQDIVSVLEADESVAIAVTGDYGSGKSQVLHHVHEILRKNGNDEFHVVTYAPWRYAPDATTLRRTFLNEVIRQTPTFDGKPRVLGSRPARLELKATRPKVQKTAEIWSAVQALWRPFLVFLGIGVLALLGLYLLKTKTGIDITTAGTILIAFGVAMATAIGDKLVRQTYDLQFENVTSVESQHTTEIDDFESQYRKFRESFHGFQNNARIVVLVDDLDRCQEPEIRTVLAGLATYLGQEGGDSEVPVSFVVALDATRTENMLADQTKDETTRRGGTWGRYNLLGKHFDAIVPVPIPDLTAWSELVKATSESLNWTISTSKIPRLSRLIGTRVQFNLRELHSVLVESQLIRWHWEREENEDTNVEAIISNEEYLVRCAVFRVMVPLDRLKKFLSGPLDRAASQLEEVERELVGPILQANLDPRPVLALGVTSGKIIQLDNLPAIGTAITNGDDKKWDSECPIEDLDADMAMEVAAYIARTVTPTYDPSLANKQFERMMGLLERSIREIRNNPRDTAAAVAWLNKLASSVNTPPPADISKRVVRVAATAGPDVLKSCFATKSAAVFSQAQEQPALKEAVTYVVEAARDGTVHKELMATILDAATSFARNDPQKQQTAASLQELHGFKQLLQVPGTGPLVHHILNGWDPQTKPVPDWLVSDEAIDALLAEGLENEARVIYERFSNNPDDSHGSFAKMVDNGWDRLKKRTKKKVDEGST